jgi:competence protein CoiA
MVAARNSAAAGRSAGDTTNCDEARRLTAPNMKFALVNGQREEAQPNLSGECPGCGSPTVAKCGELRVLHWAHKGRQLCDPWWENETEWHRAWKDQFPAQWQEIVHRAGEGERHIADVKTGDGWVIEFQHSCIDPEERRSRDTFYSKLIWVVDGKRRKRDGAQFLNAWNQGLPVGAAVRRVGNDACSLLREWTDSDAPIFLDFGGEMLGWVFGRSTGGSYVAQYSRARFIETHRDAPAELVQEFDAFVNDVPKLIADYESRSQAQPQRWNPLQPPAPRRRFRF